jgi:SAM-dependent methyltransferase
MLAFDGSPRSLELARQAALAHGVNNIRFEKADVEHVSLPASSFDLVLMNMSLHHVHGLRRLLDEVRQSLKLGGVLLINEFIGPRQFQFSERQLRIVTALLSALPAEWPRDSVTGTLKTQYVRMPVEHWNAADPSEAIRSDRIVAEVTRQFQITERLDPPPLTGAHRLQFRPDRQQGRGRDRAPREIRRNPDCRRRFDERLYCDRGALALTDGTPQR